MIRSMAFLVCASAFCVSCNAAKVGVGDTVLAYWDKGDAYFVGTAVEKRGSGYLVVFEDGDTAVVDESKIRANDIKVGTKVIARWEDGRYYNGTVARIVGRALYIHYEDGDKGWAPWSWIAVQH